MKQYVNLHSHSVMSMLDGHAQIERYAQRAAELGQPGLAITDHGNIHGWMEHYEKCNEYGIKPILGSEMYQARKTRFDRDEEERAGKAVAEFEQRGPYHLTVLAKDNVGYRNLIKLSSEAFATGFFVKPRLDFDLLSEYAEGLIVGSGCLGGGVCQALLRGDLDAAIEFAAIMQSIVGKENYFIEVHNHGIPEQIQVIEDLIRVSKAIDAPMIASNDSHYVCKEDADSHDAMLCVSTGARIADEDRFKFHGPEFYLKSYEEMAVNLEPEWLDNSMAVYEMVDVNLSFDEYHFPAYPKLPEGDTNHKHLRDLAEAGLKERYGDDPSEEVLERLEYELGIINRMGFDSYFLVVADLVNWAKGNGIKMGLGRGSAAASIVSYCTGITGIDPIRFSLPFERFLIEGRNSPPDVDMDVADIHRDTLIEYTRDTYGEDHVCHIVTFSEEQARSAIRDATRVLGYEVSLGDKLSKMLPEPVMGFTQSIAESLESDEDLAKIYDDDANARKIIDTAKGLEGVTRQTGVHAAGIVVTHDPVTDYIPTMQKGEDAVITTQWDMGRVEQNGLLKIDFLGLRNLTVLGKCLEILESEGITLDLDADTSYDDTNTYELVQRGETTGVFQFESGPMQQLAMRIKPERIEHLMALTALYRPGPLGSGMDKAYARRKNGEEKVSYYHPATEVILKPTYGLMIYQEQILSIAREVAGFSASEADNLRRVIGKKKLDEIDMYEDKFVEGCSNTSSIPESISRRIYQDIKHFGAYGFSSAHAAAYSVLSYQTAYLKTHYPIQYMTALMSTVANNKDRLYAYLNETKVMGIEVLPPSINDSGVDFTIQDGKIVFGLSAIDGLGDATINSILETRGDEQLDGLYDFMRKAPASMLDKRSIEKLLLSGALDPLLMEEEELDDKNTNELLTLERKQIGLFLSGHPLASQWEKLSKGLSHNINQIEDAADGSVVTIAGVVTKFTKRKTKSGNMMFIFEIEDLTGTAEVLVFNSAIEKGLLTPESLALGLGITITARVNKDIFMDNEVNKLFYISHEVVLGEKDEFEDVYVLDVTDVCHLEWKNTEINDILINNGGTETVVFKIANDDREFLLKAKNRISREGIKLLRECI